MPPHFDSETAEAFTDNRGRDRQAGGLGGHTLSADQRKHSLTSGSAGRLEFRCKNAFSCAILRVASDGDELWM